VSGFIYLFIFIFSILRYNFFGLSFQKIKLIKFAIKKSFENSNFLVEKVTKFVGNEISQQIFVCLAF
jgi:hypothetical protein